MAAPTLVLVKNGRRGYYRHGLNHLDVYATSAGTDNWADQTVIDLSAEFPQTPYPLGIKLYKMFTRIDGTCTAIAWELNFATDLAVFSPVSPTLNIGETKLFGIAGQKSPASEMWDNCVTTWTATTNVTAADETTIVVANTVDATPTSQKLTLATAFTTGKIGYITGATDSADEWEGVSFYIRPTIAITPGQLAFCTSESAALGTPEETLLINTYLPANEWTYVELFYTTATTNRDVVSSHGLWAIEDVGACSLYIDNIRHIKRSQRFPSMERGSALSSPYGDLVLTSTGIANGDVFEASVDFEFCWNSDIIR